MSHLWRTGQRSRAMWGARSPQTLGPPRSLQWIVGSCPRATRSGDSARSPGAILLFVSHSVLRAGVAGMSTLAGDVRGERVHVSVASAFVPFDSVETTARSSVGMHKRQIRGGCRIDHRVEPSAPSSVLRPGYLNACESRPVAALCKLRIVFRTCTIIRDLMTTSCSADEAEVRALDRILTGQLLQTLSKTLPSAACPRRPRRGGGRRPPGTCGAGRSGRRSGCRPSA